MGRPWKRARCLQRARMEPPIVPPTTTLPTPPPDSKSRSKEWKTPKRSRVFALIDEGNSARVISKKTGVPESTVSRWRRELAAMATHAENARSLEPEHHPGKQCPGPRYKLTERDIRWLISTATHGYEERKLCWRKPARDCDLDVSAWMFNVLSTAKDTNAAKHVGSHFS